MYRIMKDNSYKFIYKLQKRYFGFLWITITTDSLEVCRYTKRLGEWKGAKYTFVE